MDLIKERVNLIMEYIEQILSMQNYGKISIYSKEINGENHLVLDVLISKNKDFEEHFVLGNNSQYEKNFERHYDLGIDSQDNIKFYRNMLDTLVEKYLESYTFGISKYYNIRGEFGGPSFSGLYVTNQANKSISLDFSASGKDFYHITEDYNNKIREKSKKNPNLISNIGVPILDLDDLFDSDEYSPGSGPDNGPGNGQMTR